MRLHPGLHHPVSGAPLSAARARSLIRKARRRPYPPGTPLARLRILWRCARHVFNDPYKAERFLTTPHPMLEMQSPVACAMQSDAALDAVVAILDRMAQGTAG